MVNEATTNTLVLDLRNTAMDWRRFKSLTVCALFRENVSRDQYWTTGAEIVLPSGWEMETDNQFIVAIHVTLGLLTITTLVFGDWLMMLQNLARGKVLRRNGLNDWVLQMGVAKFACKGQLELQSWRAGDRNDWVDRLWTQQGNWLWWTRAHTKILTHSWSEKERLCKVFL